MRNGPAKFQVNDERTDWFDGLAVFHAFEFSPQQVLYTNRFLRSEQYFIMMKMKELARASASHPIPMGLHRFLETVHKSMNPRFMGSLLE